MKYPLVGLCIAFCLGIITAAYLKIPFLTLCFATLLFLLLGIIFIKQNNRFTIFILCAVFFLGAALLRNSQILANHHIAKLIPYKAESVSVVGVIDNDPIYQDRNVSFILKTEKVGIGDFWQKACGKILVRVFKKEAFSYGDRLFLRGNLYRPFSFL